MERKVIKIPVYKCFNLSNTGKNTRGNIMLTRRTITSGFIAAPFIARAQGAYPAAGSTIRVVVPYPAGGTTDIVGRVFAERLGAMWNVTTVVENISGAGSTVGMDRVVKGASDGMTILICSPNISTNEFLYARMPFDTAKDLTFLSQIVAFPNLLCFRKTLEINTVPELIAFAKKNPGKLTYASSGVGTTIHLSAEMFKKMTGTEMLHVPYRGSALAINDLVGGQVDLMFDNIPSIIPQAQAGTVKPIAVTSLNRSTTAKEYPPISEWVPGYDATSWFGSAVKTGTSPEICAKIEAATIAMCKDPAVIARFAKLHADTIGSTAAQFSKHVVDERVKWGKLITELKIKAE
jgi:tripartite-type tricarboxylate transporter receptor subunit TctC